MLPAALRLPSHLGQPPALPPSSWKPRSRCTAGRQRLSLLEQQKASGTTTNSTFSFQGPRHPDREPATGRPQKIPQRPLSELLLFRAHRRRTPPKSRGIPIADGDIPKTVLKGLEKGKRAFPSALPHKGAAWVELILQGQPSALRLPPGSCNGASLCESPPPKVTIPNTDNPQKYKVDNI